MKPAFDPIKHVMNLGPALYLEAIMAKKYLYAPPTAYDPPKTPSAAAPPPTPPPAPPVRGLRLNLSVSPADLAGASKALKRASDAARRAGEALAAGCYNFLAMRVLAERVGEIEVRRRLSQILSPADEDKMLALMKEAVDTSRQSGKDLATALDEALRRIKANGEGL